MEFDPGGVPFLPEREAGLVFFITEIIHKIHSRGRFKYCDSCLLLSLMPETVSWELGSPKA
mgnify:CR=1 FL=1